MGVSSNYSTKIRKSQSTPLLKYGFTIVELLVVVVVIAILASITVVGYNGVTNKAKETALKSDLRNASTQLHLAKLETGIFPDDTTDIKKSDSTTFNYSRSSSGGTFCLVATSDSLPGLSFYITESSSVEEGECEGVAEPVVTYLQTITSSNCPTTRTVAVDARDNHTYWIQRLADTKCWMLTNLSYSGGTSNGGSNTYGDIRSLSNGTSDTVGTYTEAKYYIHASSNPTVNPADPFISTDGGVTGTQYGYYYNYCAAMGSQTSTSACANATTPTHNVNVSVCPSGWRLPSMNEFSALRGAIDSGASTDASLRSVWLVQRSGSWISGFNGFAGTSGHLVSSTQASASAATSFTFGTSSGGDNSTGGKSSAHPVRCFIP